MSEIERKWSKVEKRIACSWDEAYGLLTIIRNAGIKTPFPIEAFDLGFGRGVIAGPGDRNCLWDIDGRRYEVWVELPKVQLFVSQEPDPWYFEVVRWAGYRPFIVKG